MAYDQNSIPKDLRPLNIMRSLHDDPRISPATSSGRPVDGYYASPPNDGSPGTMPVVYYPATIPESGFVPRAFNNAITGWIQQIVPPHQGVVNAALVNPYTASPNSGALNECSPSDHTSDEGGDDSLSGPKVKFLCSFGGKILPRLSDGELRYVGGQTRIISVEGDVLFGEFVQKMADTYVQNSVIKYQLPDQDLDALVTVSCCDDLENMMDEYEKLVERCSDGSAKLRIFLFSPSDLESPSHIGDLHDGGQQYVEAVNGIGDMFSGGGDCILRKESIESTISVETSDPSGAQGGDGAGEVLSRPSTGGGVVPFDLAQPLVYPDSYAALGVVTEQEVVPQASAVMSYPASSSPYMQASHQEALSHQIPPQMGFPTQIVGTVRQVFTQQPMAACASSQQFAPSVRMRMTPSFIGMRPNVVPAVGRPQQIQVESYPTESMMPQRFVQYNLNQAQQVSTPSQGGMYNWQKIPHPEHISLAELQPERITRIEESKGSPSSTISDQSSSSCSLPLDCQGWPLIRPVGTGTRADGNMEQLTESGRVQTEASIPQGVVSGVQIPYGVFMANNLPSPQNLVAPLPECCPTGCPLDDPTLTLSTYDNVRQIDRRSQIKPSEGLYNIEHNIRNEDSQIPVGEVLTPPIGNPYNSSSDDITRALQRLVPINEWNDNVLWSQPRIGGDNRDVSHDTSTQQFINQDPWSVRPDTQYPPPRPTKIQIKTLGDNHVFNSGETSTGSQSRDSVSETPRDDGAYQLFNNLNWDVSPNLSLSDKGSTEEQIRTEVEVVAEVVAISALQSSIHLLDQRSDSPHISKQNCDDQRTNIDTEEQQDNFDEIKTKLSENINLGFPASGIGRLQIIMNSDLEELRELGSGTFGTVYHGKWRGTDVAIKRINDRCFFGKPSEQERMRDDFWNEAIKLADLHHPNVVAFYGVVLDGPEGSVATVTEYMVNGSLRNALQRNDRILDKRKRLLIGMDVAFGMEYLHGKNIVHFDLKSDNLLVNLRDPHRPICKVGDLGLSKVKCQTLISGGVRGTLPWMAPELLNGSSSLVSEKVDVFSFGIVMWELLTAEEPYADLHYGAIIGGIVSNTLRPPVPEACDPDWRALMERCWSSEPSERPNFTRIADELRAMANNLPSKLQHPLPKTC